MSQTGRKVIRATVRLLELANQLGNVTRACRVLGDARDGFYRFRDLCERGGELAQAEMTRASLKNQVAPEVDAAVVEMAVERHARGQARVSNELRQRGIEASPFGARNLWLHHDLANMKHRPKPLEAKVISRRR